MVHTVKRQKQSSVKADSCKQPRRKRQQGRQKSGTICSGRQADVKRWENASEYQLMSRRVLVYFLMAKKMVRDLSANHSEQHHKTTNQWGGYEISRAKKVHWEVSRKANSSMKYTAIKMPPG